MPEDHLMVFTRINQVEARLTEVLFSLKTTLTKMEDLKIMMDDLRSRPSIDWEKLNEIIRIDHDRVIHTLKLEGTKNG